MSITDLIFSWTWCGGENSIEPILHMVKLIINILRIVVPIALIVMTSLDIAKKVINPDDKDGQKKIMIRAIAALLVFLAPTIIHLTLHLIAPESTDGVDSSLSACWDRA